MLSLSLSLLLLSLYPTSSTAAAFNSTVVAVVSVDRTGEGAGEGRSASARAWSLINTGRLLIATGHEVEVEGNGEGDVSAESTSLIVTANTLAATNLGFSVIQASRDVDRNQEEKTTEVTTEASIVGFHLALGHIVEFEDTNGEAGLQADDNITGWYNLRYLLRQWNDIKCGENAIGDTDSKVRTCLLETKDGVFTARISVSDDFAEVEGTPVGPDRVKVDIGISNWFGGDSPLPPANLIQQGLGNYKGPSSAEDAPNARLGLTAVIVAKTKKASWDGTRSVDSSSGTIKVEGELSFGAGDEDTSAFFDWEREDSAGVGVTATVLPETPGQYPAQAAIQAYIDGENAKEGVTAKFMTFSFDKDRVASVAWDPEFALDTAGASRTLASSALGLGLLALINLLF
jgi:hypothetical protein